MKCLATPWKWRRGRDSNPRTAQTVSGFQNRRIRPLCHPSSALNCMTGELYTILVLESITIGLPNPTGECPWSRMWGDFNAGSCASAQFRKFVLPHLCGPCIEPPEGGTTNSLAVPHVCSQSSSPCGGHTRHTSCVSLLPSRRLGHRETR